MNRFVDGTFKDGDLMLFMTDMTETYEADDPIFEKLKNADAPVFLLINKTDLAKPEEVLRLIQKWDNRFKFNEIFPISALKKHNTDRLFDLILKNMPEGPVYYPKDQLTDKPERFFINETIREKILMHYKKEIPYAVEVDTEEFFEEEEIIRIRSVIMVERETQKGIIIGHKGSALKRVGVEARKDLEKFFGKQIHIELYVKVNKNWRSNQNQLKRFGYNN